MILILMMIFRPNDLLGHKEFQLSKVVSYLKEGWKELKMPNSVLVAKDISIEFGALKAVENFNLKIEEKDLIGLIGPNGAGKDYSF